MLVVKDVDAFVRARGRRGRADRARRRATSRTATARAILRDPFGHRWFVATPIENVATEEIQKRIGDDFRIE